MAMLRKPLHRWRIKQEVQKLTVIRPPAPRLNPVPEWAGSGNRPTSRTSLSPLPHLFFFYCHNLRPTFPPLSTSSFATQPPSTVAYHSRAPEPDPDSAEDQLEEPNPNAQSQVDEDGNMPEDSPQQEYFHGIPIPIEVANKMPKDSAQQRYVGVYPIETNLYEEALDHFYQEMSKEVETILRKPDPRLPKLHELPTSVVVTCVSEDCTHVYVYLLERKCRSRVSAAKAQGYERKHRCRVRAAKESCRELEVWFALTSAVGRKTISFRSPSDKFPFEAAELAHKWKVVNKFEFPGGVLFDVMHEEATKYARWLIAQNKLACKDMGKDVSNATLGKV